MKLIDSADGTPIAVHESGTGPAVIIVNGAFSTARDAAPIADAFAQAGLRAVRFDRRARGESGHTPPVDPRKEVDDLAAVITASGGHAAVVGHSSGAILGLYAAGEGVEIERLFLSEPPFRFGEGEPSPDLPERLQSLIDEGRPEDAVLTFQREGIELPESMIEQIRDSPIFEGMVSIAQSTVYDAMLTREVSTPTAAMREVRCPVTILCGVETFPFLVNAAKRLAEMMPSAEYLEVPESVGHRLDPTAAARIVAERLR
jgi:pimeloyl-ACP methyl ester carboxylesterase